MRGKWFMVFLAIFAIGAGAASLAAQEAPAGYRAIAGHFSPRAFGTGAVSQADLDRILAAAVRAPSAGNRQPWHFAVIRGSALVRRVVSNAEDGNILIIVSAPADANPVAPAIDCGIAAQSIYLAAQSLGLASRLYTGPITTVNGMKSDLGIPAANTAFIAVRIGRMPPGVDASTGASARRDAAGFTSYR